MKRYGFTKETKVVNGVTVHRIIALQDFYIADAEEPKKIKQGTLGGWIEKEDNLVQDGLAWVTDEAVVYGGAEVTGAALICDEAQVCGETGIRGYVQVRDSAKIGCGDGSDYGLVVVTDYACVYGSASVVNRGSSDLEIREYAEICENAEICARDSAYVTVNGQARVCGHAKLGEGTAHIKGRAVVTGYTHLKHGVTVCDNAVIDMSREFDHPTTAVGSPRAKIGGDAYIKSPCDCLTVGPFFTYRGDSGAYLYGDYMTFSITNEGEVQFVTNFRSFRDTDNQVYSLNNLDRLELRLRRSEEFHEATDLVIQIARAAKSYFDREREARDALLEQKKPKHA